VRQVRARVQLQVCGDLHTESADGVSTYESAPGDLIRRSLSS
jgi:hypothetical protein